MPAIIRSLLSSGGGFEQTYVSMLIPVSRITTDKIKMFAKAFLLFQDFGVRCDSRFEILFEYLDLQ